MPDLKISQLPVASATTGAELFPVVQGGVTKQIALNAVRHIGSAVFDAPGNIGLGVTPSAWNSVYKAMQLGLGASVSGRTDLYNYLEVQTNSLRTGAGTWNYIASDTAAQYIQNNGIHVWLNAPSGTAGNAISFVQAMTLDASGRLGVGTPSPANKLSVIGKIGVGPADFTATATCHASEASGADRAIGQFSVSGASNGLQVNWNHAASKMHIIINNIPTASAGLPSGTLWSDAGTIKIA